MTWVIILLIAGAVIWYFRNSGEDVDVSASSAVALDNDASASPAAARLFREMFPQGAKDVYAGVKEVQHILGGRIARKEALNIFVQSYTLMTRREGDLDKDRLTRHLKGYCWEHFDDAKVDALLLYLHMVKLSAAMGGSPASVRRTAEGGYEW